MSTEKAPIKAPSLDSTLRELFLFAHNPEHFGPAHFAIPGHCHASTLHFYFLRILHHSLRAALNTISFHKKRINN